MESKYKRMMILGEKEATKSSVIEISAKLAKQLIEGFDQGKIWKILADFWTEMVLFVTPSDDAFAHSRTIGQWWRVSDALVGFAFPHWYC